MGKFIKKDRKTELDINGILFYPDFGQDEIPVLLEGLSNKFSQIEEKYSKEVEFEQKHRLILEEEKKLFKETINALLQDDSASDEIFKEDDTGVYHAEVYTFLAEEYEKYVNAHISQYQANRAERRNQK